MSHSQRQLKSQRCLYVLMPLPCVRFPLDLPPQVQDSLGVLHNLITTQLALAVETIDERDGNLLHVATHSLGPHNHLHLERVTLGLGAGNDLLQHLLLVQSEATGAIADAGAEHGIAEQVGAAADELALEIPAVDAAVAGVAGAGDDVGAGAGLDRDHLGDELGVVREVGVHDDDEVALGELQPVDVGRAQAQLARARLQHDARGAVDLLQLLGNVLRAIRGAVVDDDEFPIELSRGQRLRQSLHWDEGGRGQHTAR
jgi:hypothetical protein